VPVLYRKFIFLFRGTYCLNTARERFFRVSVLCLVLYQYYGQGRQKPFFKPPPHSPELSRRPMGGNSRSRQSVCYTGILLISCHSGRVFSVYLVSLFQTPYQVGNQNGTKFKNEFLNYLSRFARYRSRRRTINSVILISRTCLKNVILSDTPRHLRPGQVCACTQCR
jgi:hypothetical protein